MKRATFEKLDQLLKEVNNDKVIVGSSTSTIKGSLFTHGLSIEERSIVVHPVSIFRVTTNHATEFQAYTTTWIF